MGNIKPSEIKVLVLLVVGLLAFIFEKQIGYPGTMVYSLIMLLAFLPGVDLCDGKSFSKLNLSFVFFLASCQAIGMVARRTSCGQMAFRSNAASSARAKAIPWLYSLRTLVDC